MYPSSPTKTAPPAKADVATSSLTPMSPIKPVSKTKNLNAAAISADTARTVAEPVSPRKSVSPAELEEPAVPDVPAETEVPLFPGFVGFKIDLVCSVLPVKDTSGGKASVPANVDSSDNGNLLYLWQ